MTVGERNTYATKITDYINSVFSLRDLHKKEKVIDEEEEIQQSKRLKIEHRNNNTISNNLPVSSGASTSKSNCSNSQPKTVNTRNQNSNISVDNSEPMLQNANFVNSSKTSSGKLEAMTIKEGKLKPNHSIFQVVICLKMKFLNK